MELNTGEFVGIEINETSCGMVTIQVGGKDYAQFQNARLEDVDIQKVIDWVEGTAYDGSYLSDAYISPDLMLSEFAKYVYVNIPEATKAEALDIDADGYFAITQPDIY